MRNTISSTVRCLTIRNKKEQMSLNDATLSVWYRYWSANDTRGLSLEGPEKFLHPESIARYHKIALWSFTLQANPATLGRTKFSGYIVVGAPGICLRKMIMRSRDDCGPVHISVFSRVLYATGELVDRDKIQMTWKIYIEDITWWFDNDAFSVLQLRRCQVFLFHL